MNMTRPRAAVRGDFVADARHAPIRPWQLLLPLLAAAAITLGAMPALAQAPSPPPQARGQFPSLALPDRSQGDEAIARLGNRLPDVAAFYGMSVTQFVAMLRYDRSVWLDRRGRVYFEEEVRLPAEGSSAPEATDPLSPLLEPLDQTFRLHSRPGAKRTIYLNFAGATLTGTAWNQSTGQSTITALPFDLDGSPYAFGTSELQRIQYIWKRVAEDFSAFDVDVTTEPPPADRLTRSSSSDDVFGTTVLITKRTFYSCSCGGVAYLTAFDDTSDYYKPALVFYDALGSGSEKYVADAITHEAGHNVGLAHDGTSSTGYYQGHGSGATGWAPIMGVGYYQQLVQWSKGEYAGANNTQDDYVVMQATGLPLRADDHGNGVATATALASSTSNGVTTVAGSGVIERAADRRRRVCIQRRRRQRNDQRQSWPAGSETRHPGHAARQRRNRAGDVQSDRQPAGDAGSDAAVRRHLLRDHRRHRQGRSARYRLQRLRQRRSVRDQRHRAGGNGNGGPGAHRGAGGDADLGNRAARREFRRRGVVRSRRQHRLLLLELRRRQQPDRRRHGRAHLRHAGHVHGNADGDR